tara:strand:+ start:210 stop:3257 length:3048 start_codon:yes stop_codon:yes gene_type:complete
MAAINQRIPNFLGGISQQPDFIKFPGQLRACDNAVPDVTFGLMKRPPAEYVNKLTNTTAAGQWFEILNKDGEKYIVQITPANYASTPIRVWNLETGVEVTVTEGSGNAYDYLNGAGTLGKHTIQDYTYITNPNKTVGTTGTTDTYNSGNKYAFIKIDTLAYNTEYSVFLGGATAAIPTPGTKNRATALKVYRYSGGSGITGKNSWVHEDVEDPLGGQADFDGNNNASGTGNTGSMVGVRGTVLVNGQPFFDSQTKEYQTDANGNQQTDDASKFLGYTQDYDIRYTATVTMKDGGTDVTLGAKSHVIIPKASSGSGVEYTVEVVGVKAYDTYVGVSNVATYKTPKNPDDGTLSLGTVITKLSAEINSKYSSSGFTAEVVGNGILIKRNSTTAFKAHVMGGMANEALSVFQDSAQDISKLPSECAHGYIVEVANTEESDADNYWLTFKADNGQDGAGVWEETVAPGITAGLDKDTLPHALVAVRSGGNIASFQFCKLGGSGTNPNNLEWDTRKVGDLETNPDPSFVGKEISQIFFYRNRLGFIANEQIVMSQPSSYHNFFAVSAITASDDNPIDISVSDVKPAYINHVLPTQKGVMMFSEAGQFMLFSDQDSFSPKTARLKKLAGYECSNSIKPLDMGTTYMFVNHAGAHSRAFEMAIVDESIPPKIIDQTRVVPEFLPKTLNVSSGSADLGLVTYIKNDDTYSSSNRRSSIFNYKYFDSGDQREQSAWYTWTLTGVVKHCFYSAGFFYTITQQENNEYILNRHEYISDDSIAGKSMGKRRYTIGDSVPNSPTQGYAGFGVNRRIDAALDNLVTYLPSDSNNTTTGVTVAYSSSTGNTVITVPYTLTSNLNPTILVLSNEGDDEAGVVKQPDSVSGTTMTFNNLDMSNWHMAIGYNYVTSIELPQYYFSYDQGKYDIDGDLRIGGYNFELGLSGPLDFFINDVVDDSTWYTQQESGMLANLNKFQEIPSSLYKSVRVPIYKNNNEFRFWIFITQPFSATIVSASWDGRYNTRRHVRK